MPRGTTMLKSASQAVFVDGTIPPTLSPTRLLSPLRASPGPPLPPGARPAEERPSGSAARGSLLLGSRRLWHGRDGNTAQEGHHERAQADRRDGAVDEHDLEADFNMV